MRTPTYSVADLQPTVEALLGTDLSKLFAWQAKERAPVIPLKKLGETSLFMTVPLDAWATLKEALSEHIAQVPGLEEFISRVDRNCAALRETLERGL